MGKVSWWHAAARPELASGALARDVDDWPATELAARKPPARTAAALAVSPR